MLGAVAFGHDQMQPVIDAIIDLAELAAKEPWDVPEAAPEVATVREKLAKAIGGDLKQAYTIKAKQARVEAVAEGEGQGPGAAR